MSRGFDFGIPFFFFFFRLIILLYFIATFGYDFTLIVL